MMTERIIKIKVYGGSLEDTLLVSDRVRSLYAPNVTQSEVKKSDQPGFHCFLTVYLEEIDEG